MGTLFLSEAINFERDIQPFKVIRIYSGVGSGKNHWVETLANAGYSILLITSRKATADAQAKKLSGSRWINLSDLSKNNFEIEKQNTVVVTNAGIEQFLKTKYNKDDESTHIWRYFDFIILDEAHSLVADATFSDSPFHVMRFLQYVLKKHVECKIVFMTGTPAPIDQLFSEKLLDSPDFNSLDLYQTCKCVTPKEVLLIPTHSIVYDIVAELERGSRIIYFANSISRIETLVKELCVQGIEEQNIGIAYSGNEQRSFSKTIFENKSTIRTSLLERESIPKEFKILLTTTQNKEGINIIDDDIKVVITESCDHSSIIQMAGRVRKGIDFLVILYDANQHHLAFTPMDLELDYFCLDNVKIYYCNCGSEQLKECIETVERRFPGIRYCYLRERFCFYSTRYDAISMIRNDHSYIQQCIKTWNQQPYKQGITIGQGEYDLQKWFPNSTLTLYRKRTIEEQEALLSAAVKKEILPNYLGRLLTPDDKKQLAGEINSLLDNYDFDYSEMKIKKPVKQLNPFLSHFGYDIAEAKGKRKGSLFEITPQNS